MATTLLLDRENWDLALDAQNNIALAAEPYAQLQDAASACRTFAGECWYDTRRGVPFFTQVFRGPQPVQVLKARMAAESELVPGVAAVDVVLSGLTERTASGQVQITFDDGTTGTAML